MEIGDLQCLVACGSAGTLGRAARLLGIETSTVSRRLNRLEEELGIALLERNAAGARLTQGGKAVVFHAKRAMAELDALKYLSNEHGAGQRGEIHLGVRLALTGDRLAGLLRLWRARHSGVRLTVSEMNDYDLAAALDQRHLDVVLTFSQAIRPHCSRMPVYRDRIAAAVPQGHRLAERPTITWSDLRGERILVQGWDDSQVARDIYGAFLGPDTKFQSHGASEQSVFALASAGFGITLTTASWCESGFPGLVFREIADSDASIEMALGWLPQLEDPSIGRFVAFLRDAVGSGRLL